MRRLYGLLTTAALLAATACAPNRPTPPRQDTARAELPGKKPDGSVLLPNQWSLRPVGEQVELGDFPINVAVHPSGRFAAVLHSGYSAHEILVVDVSAAKVSSRTPVHETFYGLEFSSDGRKLFCSGAGDEVVHRYDFQNGVLTNHGEIRLRDPKLRAVPAGLAINNAGDRLFVANVWGNRVTRVDLSALSEPSEIVLGPMRRGSQSRRSPRARISTTTRRPNGRRPPSTAPGRTRRFRTGAE